jgi:hypothetical protein
MGEKYVADCEDGNGGVVEDSLVLSGLRYDRVCDETGLGLGSTKTQNHANRQLWISLTRTGRVDSTQLKYV